MSFKPVVLLYDLDNELVDECSTLIGHTGLYTTINTYNETNALEVVQAVQPGLWSADKPSLLRDYWLE
jgi:isochorismate hydrolase